MSGVNKFIHVLRNFEEILCSLFLVTMIGLVLLNVFLRYLFSYSISWAEEVATICFVWCVFVGASATYKHKLDVGIDVLVTKAPAAVERAIRLFVALLLLILNGYLFYMAVVFTRIAWIKPTAVLGISSAVFNAALVVAFGLITWHSLRFLIAELRNPNVRGEAI
ncbi:MAG: TRAP transporter small permease [Pseudomonadota bacterium]